MELQAMHGKCSGCGVCRQTCALENFREVNPAKAFLKIEGRFPSPGDYQIHVCNQCGECADNCPVEAISLKEGVYVIDTDECTECMTCVEVCPRGVMMTPPGESFPFKCTLCGKCAEICPRRALVMVEG